MWVDMKQNFGIKYLASSTMPRRSIGNYQLDTARSVHLSRLPVYGCIMV